MPHKIKAEVVDIFSSMQGEGIFVGARQIFVRFKRCNLACGYCDEPRDGSARLYSPSELMSEIAHLERTRGAHHSVSLTGGEPLCYADFLEELLPLLSEEHITSYLETNGTLPGELGRVIDLIDIVAMDFKLPSSTGERDFWKEHKEFLAIAARKKVFVKAVVTQQTTKEDVEKAITLVSSFGKHIPFILQPATPVRTLEKTVDSQRLLGFIEIGAKHHFDNIRVIPQVHKMLGVK